MSAQVPFVRGFRPPSEKQRLAALLARGERSEADVPPAFRPGPARFFPPLARPSHENDWLAQYKEEGQSFRDFCRWSPFTDEGGGSSVSAAAHAVVLLPVGEFRRLDVSALAEYTGAFFGVPCRVLPAARIEERRDGTEVWWSAAAGGRPRRILSRHSAESGHRQLDVGSVLQAMSGFRHSRSSAKRGALFTVAVTEEDLFDGDENLFVAGTAQGNRGVACFSFFRYDPWLTFSGEHWWDVRVGRPRAGAAGRSPAAREGLMLARSARLLVHEAAHLAGVDHCTAYACIMNGSGHLDEDFRQPSHLCPVDLRKLQLLAGFDPAARYVRLRAFYDKHGLIAESAWVADRLAWLRGGGGGGDVIDLAQDDSGDDGGGDGGDDGDDDRRDGLSPSPPAKRRRLRRGG